MLNRNGGKVRRTKKLDDEDKPIESFSDRERRIPVFIVLRGHEIGRRYAVKLFPATIGSVQDKADLTIEGDAWVSSVHALITMGDNEVFLEDAGSRNGTFLNGALLKGKRKLSEGDKVSIGKTILKFTYHDPLEAEFHTRLEHMMNVDELTGLPVNRVFQARFSSALETACSIEQPVTFLMMDMDGLKRINDTHGHHVGAGTIAGVGRILGDIVNPSGLVTRFGGDEFSAFLAPCKRQEGLILAERIRTSVEKHQFEISGVRVKPTISIGISSMPENGRSVGDLFLKADEALYRAKRKGRNCVSE
jgi:two-component system cell cycle response regulator